jgi:glycosyltransferase involved in cell wall biosynthesis
MTLPTTDAPPASTSAPAPGDTAPALAAEQERQLVSAQERITRLQDEVESLKRQLDEFRNSTSWKITAIFRHPLSRLINLRYSARLAKVELANRGGLGAVLADQWQSLRLHKLEYVKNLLRYLTSNGHTDAVPGSGGHDKNDYSAWSPRAQARLLQRAAQADRLLAQGSGPKISVLIPTYKPPLHLLKEAIASITSQNYGNWEICIADDASHDPALNVYLDGLAQDPRFRIAYRERNGHISACSNSALALASGDYVLLLDQDDIVPQHALKIVAGAVLAQPDARILYSDEDRMNEDASEHFGAYFKPDFNYELFLCQNMVSHLGVYHRATMVEVGGFRIGLEGSQDYDLALRVLERCELHQVVHIPCVLYHWRAIKGSTALDHSEKSYASTAGLRAVEDHLQRTGQKASVSTAPGMKFFNRVRYELAQADPVVTVLVAVDAPPAQTAAMVQRLHAQRGALSCRFVLFLGEAALAELRALVADPLIELLGMPEGGHPVARLNQAMAQHPADAFALVNAVFTQVSAGWLEELVRVAGQARSGLVAPGIRNALGQLDHGGVLHTAPGRAVYAFKGLQRGDPGKAGRAALPQRYCALSGALAVMRRFDDPALNRLDEGFDDPQFALLDKGLELHSAGLGNIWMPYSELGYTDPRFAGRFNLFADSRVPRKDIARCKHKWGSGFQERFYNPNLSAQGDFSLDWAPGA